MKKIIFPTVFIYFFLLPTVHFGQSQGNASLGFQFTPLPNWEVYETNGIYMLTSPYEAGLIVIWKNTYTQVEEIRAELSQPYQESTTSLRPDGPPEVLSNNVVGVFMSGSFTGVDCRGYLIGFVLPDGQSGNIFATRTPEGFNATHFRNLALQVTNTVMPLSTITHQMSPAVNPLQGTGNAAELLAGYRIASISSGGDYSGGYSSKEVINFCPNGTYELYRESSFAIGGEFGMASQGDQETISGFWQLDRSSGQYILKLTVDGNIGTEIVQMTTDSYGDTRFKIHDANYGYYGQATCN